jgi:hypothetical protein
MEAFLIKQDTMRQKGQKIVGSYYGQEMSALRDRELVAPYCTPQGHGCGVDTIWLLAVTETDQDAKKAPVSLSSLVSTPDAWIITHESFDIGRNLALMPLRTNDFRKRRRAGED